MRRLIIFLLLLPAAVSGQQNDAFSFYPRVGSLAGGDVVEFTTSTLDFRCCGLPQVSFGGVASPTVNVTSSTRLTALTPAHAEGVVEVELHLGTQGYSSFFRFGYARSREAFLIPVAIEIPGAFGTRWTTDMWVYNDSEEPANVNPEVCSAIGLVYSCGNPLIVAGHGTLRIPPRVQRNGDYPEMILFPPTDLADHLHFSVRVRDTSRPETIGTEIPIGRASDFRPGRLVFVNVPVSNRYRDLLRIFEQVRMLRAGATVSAFDMSTGVLLAREKLQQYLGTDGPNRATLLLHEFLTSVIGHDSVRLEIVEDDPQALLWAMLTLTDNVTQQVTVLTPQ